MADSKYIRWFADLSMADVPLVGGKNASLGEMFRQLHAAGRAHPRTASPSPPAPTATRWTSRDAWAPLHALLDGLDKRDVDALARAGAQAREIVYAAPMPAAVEADIRDAWRALEARVGRT